MVKPGDTIRVECTTGEVYEGILIPAQHTSSLVLKLSSGYNISIRADTITKKELVQEWHEERKENQKTTTQKKLPTIAVLHTGGTIASKVDYRTGGVIARYSPEDLLDLFPEIKEIANVRSRLVRNMWSEDMRFAHYNILAEEIKKEIEQGCEGIIITHGTDTLHFTSAALAFMLEDLTTPVLLVGAQRSSDRGSSDAGMNMLAAVCVLTQSDFGSVGICMHESSQDTTCALLPATKTRKMHSSRRDAFRPINTTPVAHISSQTVSFLTEDYVRRKKQNTIRIKKFSEMLRVAILKAHPNMLSEEVRWYTGFDGLILEGYGLAGNMPINVIDDATKENGRIFAELQQLIAHGTVVAATTQTLYGIVNMNVYSTGRDMQRIGILGNYCDMTPETAFIKLAWLLSNYAKDEVKILFSKNLRGEITERRYEQDTFFA